MEIGPELEFKPYSDETEERYKFWDEMWQQIPPTLHLERSRTWTNPKLYRSSEAEKSGGDKKNEL